ncbi:MAG: response regulator, partial [Planctomycetales bacterium]|nr:response regulator [Planctomycetales bacterium]
ILLLVNAECLLSCDEQQTPIEIYPTRTCEEREPASPNSLCVLVAEDSVTARLTLQRHLNVNYDCEILEAKDGSEALSLYKANRDRIDVVFTDIDMPRMTGFDLLRELQSLECEGPIAPVAVLTSRSDQRSRDTATQFGAFQYLTKPSSETAVQQVIDRVIALREHTKKVQGD